MKSVSLPSASAAIIVLLSAGCVHKSNESSPAAAVAVSGQTLSPTSERNEPRVYGDLPADDSESQSPKQAPAADWALAQEIRLALSQDSTLAKAPMQAYVNQGVVTLKGYARNERERTRLRESIAGLAGVKEVKDQLTIRNSMFGWDGTSR